MYAGREVLQPARHGPVSARNRQCGEGSRPLSRGGRQKDQALYGSVIARVVSDEGNIQLDCRCGDPGVRK